MTTVQAFHLNDTFRRLTWTESEDLLIALVSFYSYKRVTVEQGYVLRKIFGTWRMAAGENKKIKCGRKKLYEGKTGKEQVRKL